MNILLLLVFSQLVFELANNNVSYTGFIIFKMTCPTTANVGRRFRWALITLYKPDGLLYRFMARHTHADTHQLKRLNQPSIMGLELSLKGLSSTLGSAHLFARALRWHESVCGAHRGCHVNTVLPVIQDCEYVAPRVVYTQNFLCAVFQRLDTGSSICCCSSCFQHEGRKVEEQRQEMVKHVLGKRGEGAWETVAEVCKWQIGFCRKGAEHLYGFAT